jgi:hypothetical protein
MSDTVSADSIKAQMPHPSLTRVKGEPTLKQVKIVLRELTDEATMVTTGTKHALATGNMTLAWREWRRRPVADHTWPN